MNFFHKPLFFLDYTRRSYTILSPMNRIRLQTRAFLYVIALIFAGAGQASAQATLSAADVQSVIARAVSAAVALNQKVTVSVTDHEGRLVGQFAMTGTNPSTRIRSVGRAGQGLEDLLVPASAASHSKAGTAAIFSTSGNAFTTRTAGFIIQEHFPPGIDNRPGGPLYGVQFSNLACSDVVIAGLPLGLSADPGGIPLYKNGFSVGGVGIEGDGAYTVDRFPTDFDTPYEEIIAYAAAQGMEAPEFIRADNIIVEGIRLPFGNVAQIPGYSLIAFGSLPGSVTSAPVGPLASDFIGATVGGISGTRSVRFPTVNGATISAVETDKILGDAAVIANITRAGIRQPLGSNARVTISVVDVNGNVTGIFRQNDAPIFGFDVSVQKARTAAFFARGDAGVKLQNAGFAAYVARAGADGVRLNGSIAFSSRGFGFLNRPLFPDGINFTSAGPFSTILGDWSPFNDGLQLDLVKTALTNPNSCSSTVTSTGTAIGGRNWRQLPPWRQPPPQQQKAAPCPCTSLGELRNGIQIFAGGIPLYRGSVLIGAIGISGDGIDQDDFIAAGGANTFAPPEALRSDNFFVRDVRLPFIKFPPRATLP